jgi:hypothetical protein
MIDEMRCLGPSLDMIFCITAWAWRCEWTRGRTGGVLGAIVFVVHTLRFKKAAQLVRRSMLVEIS